jgi:hypothetical protein
MPPLMRLLAQKPVNSPPPSPPEFGDCKLQLMWKLSVTAHHSYQKTPPLDPIKCRLNQLVSQRNSVRFFFILSLAVFGCCQALKWINIIIIASTPRSSKWSLVTEICFPPCTPRLFIETEGSLPCTKETATGPYLEPDESNPHPNLLPYQAYTF